MPGKLIDLKIDLKRRSSRDMELLKLLLSNPPTPPVWQEGHPYALRGQPDYTLTVTHRIIRRGRKKGIDGIQKPGFRDEIVSFTVLGEGGFGIVYSILGTLAFKENELLFRDKFRAIKFISKQYKTDEDYVNVAKEYGGALLSEDLHVKPPVLLDPRFNYDFLVMQKIPGNDLLETLNYEMHFGFEGNIEHKLRRSLALLKALKYKVTDLGLIHADIKPENIMMDGESVYIIDFASAVEAFSLQAKKLTFGTHEYMAPEVFNNYTFNEINQLFRGNIPPECLKGRDITAKCDLFSMAMVLALIWGVRFPKRTTAEIMAFSEKVVISKLPVKGLSDREEFAIIHTLEKMFEPEPVNRFSVDEAIESFQDILDTYLGLVPFKEASLDEHLDRAVNMLKKSIEGNDLPDNIVTSFDVFFDNIEGARKRSFCNNLRHDEKKNIIASIVSVYQSFHGDKTCVEYKRLLALYGNQVTTSLQQTTKCRKVAGVGCYLLTFALLATGVEFIMLSDKDQELSATVMGAALSLAASGISFIGSTLSLAYGTRSLFFAKTRKIELPEPIAPHEVSIELTENRLLGAAT